MKAIWDIVKNWEVTSAEGSMSYKSSSDHVRGRKYTGWEYWEGAFGTMRGLDSVLKMSQEEWAEEYRQAVACVFEENKHDRMFESIGEFSPEELNRTIWEYEGTGRFSLEERRDALPWLFVDFY